jgi:type VI secretion system ImpH/TssG family protein
MENIGRMIRAWSRNLRQGIAAPDFWGFVRKLDDPSRPRLGYAKHPAQENIRFGQMPCLAFPAGDIAELSEGKRAGVDAVLFTYFFGLLGVNGPMPLEFTSYVYQRFHNHYDQTWRRFLDIIHHRMHVLYYRAFAQNEQSINFDRPGDDPTREIVKSFIGLPPNIDPPAEAAALFCAENFSFMARNRSGLEDALRRMLKTAVRVKDFVAAPYDLKPEDRGVLGNPATAVLGLNLQIGRSCLCATRRFEIELGPLDFDAYQALMTPSGGFETLCRTIKLYLDRPLDYGFVIRLEGGSVLPARLGFDWAQANADAAQLGYACWLGSPGREPELRIDASRFTRLRKGKQNREEPAWAN